MAKEIPTLGELELRVMQLIWNEQPCAERTIWDLIRQERNVGRTTVLKTIQRLEAKGLLKRVAADGPVQFHAVVEPQRLLPSLVERFVTNTLAGSPAALVSYLAGQEKLSAKDLAALRAIARKLEADSAE
jgi:predicted transcriptional regulator